MAGCRLQDENTNEEEKSQSRVLYPTWLLFSCCMADGVIATQDGSKLDVNKSQYVYYFQFNSSASSCYGFTQSDSIGFTACSQKMASANQHMFVVFTFLKTEENH